MKLHLNLSQLISQAWKSNWQSKRYWLYGLFAISISTGSSWGNLIPDDSADFGDIESAFTNEMIVAIIAGIILFIVIALAFYVIAIISTSSLISGVKGVQAGANPGIRSAFTTKGFWRIIGSQIVFGFIMFVAVMSWLMHMLLLASTLIGLLLVPFVLMGGIFGLTLVAGVLLSVRFYTHFGYVIDGLTLKQGMKQAFQLAQKTLPDSTILGGLSYIGNTIIMGIVAIPLFIAGFTGFLVFGQALFSETSTITESSIAGVFIGVIVIGIVTIFSIAKAVLTSFYYHGFYRAWEQLRTKA